MAHVVKLLKEFYSQRNPKFVKSDFWDKGDRRKREYFGYSEERGPFTLDEALTWKQHLPNQFEFIPESLYNKRIDFPEDFSLIFQFREEDPRTFYQDDKDFGEFKNGQRRESYSFQRVYNVIACHRGLYLSLGNCREYCFTSMDHYEGGMKERFLKRKDKTKTHYLREYTFEKNYGYYEKLEDIVKAAIDLDASEIKDCDVDFQLWYSFDMDKKKLKPLYEYTNEQLQWEYFVDSETVDGVWKPEKSTIDNIFKGYEAPKNLLKDMGIKTVRLRANCHFAVHDTFNLKGIALKAPKSVVKGYHGMDKFCEDKEIVKKIKEEEAQAKRDRELEKHNNTFTLMQHGKVIKKNANKWDIIQYLEEHEAKDLEKEIIKHYQPIFDHYKDLDTFYIARWGYHWENELRGERCDLDGDVDFFNERVVDKETLREINEIFSHCLYCPSEKAVEIKYGWPELKYCAMSVERGSRGKLKIVVEDYYEVSDIAPKELA